MVRSDPGEKPPAAPPPERAPHPPARARSGGGAAGGATNGSGALIAFRWDRLGARLTSIVNALRLAEAAGADCRVLWPVATGVSAVLNDPAELFAPGFIARYFDDSEALAARRRAALPLARALGRDGALAEFLAEGHDVAVELVSGVALLPGEDAETVAARCGAIFRAFPWADPVQATMARLAEEMAGATACHIRRGDTIAAGPAMHKPWPGKFLPEEFFRPHIAAALAEGRPVVVFSDDGELAARLAAEFPGLRTAAALLPATGLTPAQRDLLELCAMSLCARIVAPAASAFSATAAALGGRALCDAKETLPAAPRGAAHAALLARLRQRPDSFSGPGEIGQCVPHLTGWLLAEGRAAEAAALCADLAQDGLGIGFVLAEAMELTLAHDRPETVVALAALLDRQPPGNARQLVRARLAEAAAQVALGAPRAARRALLNAFANRPQEARLRPILPGLALGGGLPSAEFLPTTPALFALEPPGRALPAPGTPAAALLGLLHGGPPAALPRLGPEPFWLDWEPFLAPRLVAEMAGKGQGRRFAALLAAAAAEGDPEVRAAAALLECLGAAEGAAGAAALDRLRRLAAAVPGAAMVQHRLSRACLASGVVAEAATAAEAALAADPAPLHAGWAGMLLARRGRRRAEGAALLRAAVAADTGLPALALELAGAEERLGDTAAALGALDAAAALAPRNFHLPVQRARLLHAAGDQTGARAALHALLDEGRLPLPGWRLLVEVEMASGRPEAARAALAEGLAAKPQDAVLRALAARLG